MATAFNLYAKIVPELASNFRQHTQALVTKALAGVKSSVTIGVDVDSRSAHKTHNQLDRLADDRTVTINVDVDKRGLGKVSKLFGGLFDLAEAGTEGLSGLAKGFSAATTAAGGIASAFNGATNAAANMTTVMGNISSGLSKVAADTAGATAGAAAYTAAAVEETAATGGLNLAIGALVVTTLAAAAAAGALLTVTVAMTSAAVVAGAVMTALATAASVAAAAVAAVPAAMGSLIGAAGVLVVAMKPVVETFQAWQAATEPGASDKAIEKYKQLFGELSPAGQSFVKALQGIKASFDQIFKPLQSALLPGLTLFLNTFRSMLPSVMPALTTVGRAISSVGTTFANLFKNQKFIADLKVLMKAGAAFLSGFGKGAASLIGGLISGMATLAKSAQPVIDALNRGIAAMGPALGEFFAVFSQPAVVTGMVQAFNGLFGLVNGLLPLIGDFLAKLTIIGGPLLQKLQGPLLGIFESLFTLLTQLATGGLLDGFLVFIRGIATGLNTLVQSGVMTQLSAAFGQILVAIAPFMNDFVKALVPMMPQLVTGFGQLTTAMLSMLPALLPLIPEFMKFVTTAVRELLPHMPMIVQMFTAMMMGFTVFMRTVFNLWTTIGLPVFRFFMSIINSLWNTFNRAIAFMGTAWRSISGVLSSVYNSAIKPVIDTFKSGISSIPDVFRRAVDGAGRFWGRLKNVASVPVNFVIDKVYNNGIKKFWDGIATKIGMDPLPGLDPIKLNRGGVVPGRGPNKDTVPAMLTTGEGVLTRDEVRKLGGAKGFETFRSNLNGGRPGVGVPTGGFVDWVKEKAGEAFRGGLAPMAKGAVGLIRPIVDQIPSLFPGTLLKGGANKILDNIINWFVKDDKKYGIDGLVTSGGAGSARNHIAMAKWLESKFPGARHASDAGVRNDGGYHGPGRALDITFPDGSERTGGGMARQAFNLIKSTFFKNIKELIWDFAKGQAVWDPDGDGPAPARNHFFTGSGAGPGTHADHIHWAMNKGGIAGKYVGYKKGGVVKKPKRIDPIDKLIRRAKVYEGAKPRNMRQQLYYDQKAYSLRRAAQSMRSARAAAAARAKANAAAVKGRRAFNEIRSAHIPTSILRYARTLPTATIAQWARTVPASQAHRVWSRLSTAQRKVFADNYRNRVVGHQARNLLTAQRVGTTRLTRAADNASMAAIRNTLGTGGANAAITAGSVARSPYQRRIAALNSSTNARMATMAATNFVSSAQARSLGGGAQALDAYTIQRLAQANATRPINVTLSGKQVTSVVDDEISSWLF